jgi:glyoxylate reductase
MAKKKPLVIVTRKLPDVVETRMCELFDTRLNVTDRPMSQQELADAIRAADVIVPTVTDRIDAGIIAHAGDSMKLIANFGNGVDNIDVGAAVARGLTITNTPGVLTDDTADMALALILAVSRRVVEGANTITSGDWTGWSPTWMLGARITGKRLGIVGMGRIGQGIARRAEAFEMVISYTARSAKADLPWRFFETPEELAAASDFLVVITPGGNDTRHLINAAVLNEVRSARFIVGIQLGNNISYFFWRNSSA